MLKEHGFTVDLDCSTFHVKIKKNWWQEMSLRLLHFNYRTFVKEISSGEQKFIHLHVLQIHRILCFMIYTCETNMSQRLI
jgi:hypothetical protein